MAFPNGIADFRSDTVTRPTDEMRRAMASADVGDDVYGEDPTVKALEEAAAALVGTEAALFVPSGTMGNQIAISVHTRPGDGLLCAKTAHVARYEGGGPAAQSGVQLMYVETPNGEITSSQVAELTASARSSPSPPLPIDLGEHTQRIWWDSRVVRHDAKHGGAGSDR